MTDASARRRVLIVSENAPVPPDSRVWNESLALKQAGYDVAVVCAAMGDRWSEPYEMINGIEIHRFELRMAGHGALSYLREYGEALLRIHGVIRRLATERHIDVVHGCNPPDILLLAALPLHRHGTRFIFDHHDLVPELYQTRFAHRHRAVHRLIVAAERLSFVLADVVICPNESYRKIALTRGRRRTEDVFVVRNGPDLERFRLVKADPALKHGRAHLISYLGVIAPQDGVDQAIRALSLLRRRRDDWRAIFMGNGDCLRDVRRLADELGVADVIDFTGWTGDEEIRRVLSTSDVCLAPEPLNPLNELSSMIKLTEYMAMSRPIVSYDLPESRFSAGDAALYAPSGEPARFADRIDELLSDPARRKEMGAIGRRRVERELGWEHSARQLIAAYAHALGSDQRSRLRSVGNPSAKRAPLG